MYDLDLITVDMGGREEVEDASPTPESSDSDHQPGSSRKKKASKPRLTAVQKNTNHKDAENKRRNAIRERFTELSEMVPGAHGQERSEQVMLQKTAEFLKKQIKELRQLEAMAEQRGIHVEDHEKLKDNDFLGPDFKQPFFEEYLSDRAKKEAKGIQTAKDEDEEA